MARPEKVATVEEIKEKLEGSRAAVLTEYRGLTVSELADLRASLRAAEAEYKVYKNTLARRAAEEAGMTDLVSLLQGPTAITFVKGDAVAVAKALRDYSRTNAHLVVKGGLLGTRVIQPADVVALADIEPREVLLAKIAGGFQAPLVKAAGLFQAFTRNMAYGLKALVDKRVAEGEALPSAEAGDSREAEAKAEAEPPPKAEATAEASDSGPEATAEARGSAPEAEAPAEAAAEAPAAEAEPAEAEAEPAEAEAEAEAPAAEAEESPAAEAAEEPAAEAAQAAEAVADTPTESEQEA